MVADALRHAPASLDYLSRLRQPDIFRFCAIPQASMNAEQSIITVFIFILFFPIAFIVAIATLERVYNNPDVLEGVVKIRKVNNNNNFRKKTIQNFTKTNFILC